MKTFYEFCHYVGATLSEGGLTCSVGVDSSDAMFHEAALAHCSEGTELVELNLVFKPIDIVLSVIDLHKLTDGSIDVACKPSLEAIAAELEQMLALIDLCNFKKVKS